MRLRILHVSDLHERGPEEPERFRRHAVLADPWIRNLEEIRNGGPIDLVCFTGDAAFSGRRQEYEAATAFFEHLLRLLELPPERLFLIPGNHDVDRGRHAPVYQALRAAAGAVSSDVERLPWSRWMAGTGGPPPGMDADWRDLILERQAEYQRWVTRDLGLAALASPALHPRLGYRMSLDLGTPVHVIGLNTAWLCGDRDAPGGLLLTDDQLQRLATNGGERLAGLRIALMHHPFSDLQDGWQVQRLLAGGVDLVLRGHLHFTASSHFMLDADRQFAELAVSSLYDGGAADQYRNGCQVIEVVTGTPGCHLAGETWFRSWSSQGQFWFSDNGLYEGSRDGRLSWALPARAAGPLPLQAQLPAGPEARFLADYLRHLRRHVSQEGLSTRLIQIERVYVPQHGVPAGEEGGSRKGLLEVMEGFWNGDRRRVAVLGNYGMGKTYFALKTVLNQIDAFRQPAGRKIPVYYPLRRFNLAEAQAPLPSQRKDLLDQIFDELLALDFPRLDRDAFVDLVRQGRIGLILDGLDELNLSRETSWQSVLEPLLALPQACFAVTARTAYIQDKARDLQGWDAYEIQEWSDEEWREYVHHCRDEIQDVGGEAKFLELIASRPHLSRLTTRPLWCFMIVTVRSRIEGSADLEIADLYQEFIDQTLDQVTRMQAVTHQILSVQQKFIALERFAERCVLDGSPSFAERALTDLLSSVFLDIGLPGLQDFLAKEVKVFSFLNCDARDNYSFGHASFQEYFLAAGLARQLAKLVPAPKTEAGIGRLTFLARRELSDDQVIFLSGILLSPRVVEGLRLAPGTAAPDLQRAVRSVMVKQLSSPESPEQLRANLLRVLLRTLRRAGGRPRLEGLSLVKIQLPRLDLSECDLVALDFTAANLTRARFRHATLRECVFRRAQLDEADFTRADLAGADFSYVEPPLVPPRFDFAANADLASWDERTRQLLAPGGPGQKLGTMNE